MRQATIFITTTLFSAGIAFGQAPAEESGSASDGADCNPAIAALIGGIFGALINEKNPAQGAAIGAGLAAAGCAAINAVSRQTKTAEEVESAYVAKNGSLPALPSVTSYTASFQGGSVVSSGKPLKTQSTIDVVRGRDVLVQEVKEEIEIDFRHPSGGKVEKGAKVLTESGSDSGQWINAFTVSIPQGVPQGKYPLRLHLSINGQRAQSKAGELQVAGLESTIVIAER